MMKSIPALFALVASLLLSLLSSAHAQTGETPLKAGDQVKITITGVPAADQQSMALQTYIVSNEGTIRLQHLKSEIRAVGLTPTALARTLQDSYKGAKIYTNPSINISRYVTAGSAEMVTVTGNGVKIGGTVLHRSGMRILDAIAEKGGENEFANMKKVRLIRGNRTTEYDLSSVSSHPERNVELQPNDTIVISMGSMNPFKK